MRRNLRPVDGLFRLFYGTRLSEVGRVTLGERLRPAPTGMIAQPSSRGTEINPSCSRLCDLRTDGHVSHLPDAGIRLGKRVVFGACEQSWGLFSWCLQLFCKNRLTVSLTSPRWVSPQRRGALEVLVLLASVIGNDGAVVCLLPEGEGRDQGAVFLSLFDIVGLDEGTCGRRLLRVLAHSRCVEGR